MRKILPLVLLMSIIVIGLSAQGIALGQEEPTATETATDAPTSTSTETATLVPTETPTEIPTETPTTVVETSTPTVEAETPTPTDSGTATETATVTETLPPTSTSETPIPTSSATPTPLPTLTAQPTGLTRMFFFQGLADANVDIYANGLQLGGNIETGRMLGPFALLDGTATTLLVYPAGNLGQPTLISTLAFDPGSTVLVVAFNGPGGVSTLAVYRLDTVPGQSQFIAINASDAPSLDVVTEKGEASSLVQGSSRQITLAPGNTAGLADATGGAAAQTGMSPQLLAPDIAYLQIAVGSVANGTYRVITQAIDLSNLAPITP